MRFRGVLNCLFAAALIGCTTYSSIAAQSKSSSSNVTSAPANGASGYSKPPQYILDVMNAPSSPVPDVSPTHDTILLVSRQEYPGISRVATPYLRLAGARVEPKNHSKHDTAGGSRITPPAPGPRPGAPPRRHPGHTCASLTV